MPNRRAIATILLTVILAMLTSPLSASAANGDYAVVSGTSYLNLRAEASSGSAWLGRAYSGDWVHVLGEQNNFYYVQVVSSGQYGYMSKNYLALSEGGGGNTGVVHNPISTQFLNLRQYPSYTAPVLGIYYNGTTFTVLSSSDGWYYVSVGGVLGYFRSEFVRLTGGGGVGTAVISTANGGSLNMRTAPSSNASVAGSFANGRSVTVLLKGNNFWKVSIDGRTGFMMTKFLSSGGYVPGPTPPQPTTRGYAIVRNPIATQRLNLREQPSTSARVLARYTNGVRMEVIMQGVEWCKVYGSASGNIGYMMTEYLTLHDLPAVPIKTVSNGSSYVNLRSAPSKATGTVYSRVYSGATVTVLAPGDEWSKVQYGGITGYMMTTFLR